MSGGFRPNEQMSLPGLGMPIDPVTGQLIQPVAMRRIARLKTAEDEFRQVLHELDGSSMGSRPGDPRMVRAFTRLDEALMWAQAVILDHYGR